MLEKEIPLSGGNITGVVRIGQTVRRPIGPWSASVHGLLQYLETQGFEGAPRFLGVDQQGREILSFIEGEIGTYPLQSYMWSDENVREVARFLRRYHDATVGYSVPNGATWQFAYPDDRQHQVICHNDVAPYNMVYRDKKPRALIDWDTAGPGPRIWDIAYAVYRFIPLSYAQDMQELGLSDLTTQARRLRLFSQAYGRTLPYEEILDAVERRLEALCTLLLGRLHDPVYRKMIDEGHLDHYRHDIVSLQHHRTQLEQHL
jgi:Phosphotransferase enzyme family